MFNGLTDELFFVFFQIQLAMYLQIDFDGNFSTD